MEQAEKSCWGVTVRALVVFGGIVATATLFTDPDAQPEAKSGGPVSLEAALTN